MNKFFYARLAATNISKNRKTYIPYMLTCIITVAMFYIIKSLSVNEGILSLRGGITIASMLYLGSNFCCHLSVLHQQLSGKTEEEGIRPL